MTTKVETVVTPEYGEGLRVWFEFGPWWTSAAALRKAGSPEDFADMVAAMVREEVLQAIQPHWGN